MSEPVATHTRADPDQTTWLSYNLLFPEAIR